jgi:hypothetical protein
VEACPLEGGVRMQHFDLITKKISEPSKMIKVNLRCSDSSDSSGHHSLSHPQCSDIVDYNVN